MGFINMWFVVRWSLFLSICFLPNDIIMLTIVILVFITFNERNSKKTYVHSLTLKTIEHLRSLFLRILNLIARKLLCKRTQSCLFHYHVSVRIEVCWWYEMYCCPDPWHTAYLIMFTLSAHEESSKEEKGCGL